MVIEGEVRAADDGHPPLLLFQVFDGGIIEEEDEIMDGVLDGEYDCSARNNFEANHLFQVCLFPVFYKIKSDFRCINH